MQSRKSRTHQKTQLAAAALLATVIWLAPLGGRAVHATAPGYNGKIAFQSNRDGNDEIYTINADGSTPTNLTNNPAADDDPAWSPDGTKLVFDSKRDGNPEIYTINADGSNPLRLTNNPSNDIHPVWSPDGGKIAFISNRDGNYEIYAMSAAGGTETRITKNAIDDAFPSWNPDGTQLAWASRTNSPNYDIVIGNADGTGTVTNITNTASLTESHPEWSPDGKKISFYTNPGSNNDIYTINTDGSAMTRLTTDPGIDTAASWSPDNTKIAFNSNRNGNYEIYVMNTDGSQQARLTTAAGDDLMPAWQPIPNKAPVAQNDNLTLQTNTISAIDVLTNDTDEETLATSNLTIKVNPSHGTPSINDGKISYTPASNFVGSDQLTYQICDSFLLDQKCASAVLGISVTAGTTPAAPTITSVGTVQLNGETKIYYTGHRPTFAGTAEPGSTVTVEIHSNPMILTTTADHQGNWSVTPTQDIPNGEHQVKITATKDGATSQPLQLVLGINAGLAETGMPIWPASLIGLFVLIISRKVLMQRNNPLAARR